MIDLLKQVAEEVIHGLNIKYRVWQGIAFALLVALLVISKFYFYPVGMK